MTERTEHVQAERRLDGQFHTTRWSVVQAAGRRSTPSDEEALAALCGAYWFPLYAFLRRRGSDAEEAADLVQGFLARLIEKRDLAAADPDKGRFRAFLLTALRHFASNEWDRERAEKRGGARTRLSLDVEDAEGRLAVEPTDDRSPEDAFARSWALVVMERAMARVREDYERANRTALFERLQACMTDAQEAPYAKLAQELGMTESAFKVAVYRVRKRFRDCLRQEVADTLADPSEVEDELRALLEALGS